LGEKLDAQGRWRMKNNQKPESCHGQKPKLRKTKGAPARKTESIKPQASAKSLAKMLKTLKPHDHLCLIYETPEECRSAVVPFISIGLKRGEKCVYIVDTRKAGEIREFLREEGIDVAKSEKSRQLSILPETKAFPKQQTLDSNRMASFLKAEVEKAKAEGHPALRVIWEMSGLLRVHPGSEKLLEYEAKLNRDLFPNYPCLLICQYDRRKFDPEIIKSAIMTHPFLISGNQVYHNFYYVQPEEFLNRKRAELEVHLWLNNLECEKKMRQDLSRSEERYHTALMSVGDAVITADAKGRVELLNPVAEALTGWTQDEACGRPLEEVFHVVNEATRHEVENPVRRVVREGKVVGLANNSVLISRDGKEYAIAYSCAPVRDENNKITGVVLVFRDQTAERAAHKTLRESEEKYRMIFEGAMDAIVVASAETGIIIDCNRAATLLWGRDKSELVGQHQRTLHPPGETENGFSREFKQHLGEKRGQRLETQIVTKNGEIRDVEIVGNISEWRGQKLIHGIFRDITERKKAEEALRESEERFRSLYENNTLGLYRTTPDGRILMANPTLIKMLGYSSFEELSTRNLEKDGFEPSYPRSYFLELIERDGEIRGLEYAWIRKDGTKFFVRESARAVRDSQGKTLYYDGTVEDISDRKEAQEKIAASLREKEVLLREIHHRVKNNMQIISSLLRLQARSIEDEKMREVFNESQSRIRSMSLIHEKLYESKDFSKVDFSDYIEKMATHLFVVYRMNTQDVGFKVEAKDIHLEITEAIPCGLIINELVSNALKYAFPKGKKGEVIIRMNKDEGGKYHLSVTDTGIGLPPDFDFQKTKTLGFQIIKDLVRQLDGTIELIRKKGTEFRIVF